MEEPLGHLIVLGAALVIVVFASVRLVPVGERVVVSRFGRVHRVVGPGLVVRWPAVETWHAVTMQPTRMSLGVSGTSLDGVPVHVQVMVVCEIVDPALSSTARLDPWVATQSEIESVVTRTLATVGVADLLPTRPRQESALQSAVSATTRSWGVQVDSFEICDIEVRLTMTLLESLRGRRPKGRA